ncbi:hypothetical protein CAEBREN_26098 [Caenorhabditis brenneri]|uniref:Uncharacterized protein n=1 Tax=Caenorhabditis brenneri TaxID=135651 RepID=G0NU43_CAEBE|nr:hypothetical protein CAEBREN_26098 [Caenorhabditis brenneri]
MCSIDDDWTYVTHEDGTSLCVNVYASETTAPITYDQFIGRCQQMGEYPASINYPNDARVFTTAIEEVSPKVKGTKFYVRIDGKRTEKCRPFPFKEPCSTTAGYEFKNPMFKGSFQYYNWVTNATVRYDMDGNCLAFVYPPAKGQTMKVDVRRFCSINERHPKFISFQLFFVWNHTRTCDALCEKRIHITMNDDSF